MPPSLPRLKPLSLAAVESALARAERYRLLNEPFQAESICLDILEIDPENQRALVLLVLAITETFEKASGEAARALSLLPRLSDDYSRAYYEGVIHERQARARVARGGPGSGYVAHDGLMRAMACFERAETLRPSGNDDSILRFNACVRLLASNPSIQEAPKTDPADLAE